MYTRFVGHLQTARVHMLSRKEIDKRGGSNVAKFGGWFL